MAHVSKQNSMFNAFIDEDYANGGLIWNHYMSSTGYALTGTHAIRDGAGRAWKMVAEKIQSET